MAEDQDAEIAMYRSWWAQRRVDGVFLVDLQVDDRRVAVLEELKMPAVVIGTPAGAGSLPAVWQDDAAATRAVVEYLAGLGTSASPGLPVSPGSGTPRSAPTRSARPPGPSGWRRC